MSGFQTVPAVQSQTVRLSNPIAFRMELQLIWQAEPVHMKPVTQAQASFQAEGEAKMVLEMELQLWRMDWGTQYPLYHTNQL